MHVVPRVFGSFNGSVALSFSFASRRNNRRHVFVPGLVIAVEKRVSLWWLVKSMRMLQKRRRSHPRPLIARTTAFFRIKRCSNDTFFCNQATCFDRDSRPGNLSKIQLEQSFFFRLWKRYWYFALVNLFWLYGLNSVLTQNISDPDRQKIN